MTELVITVYGIPAPQGSKRHVGNGVMVESSKKVKPWREDVRAAALQAYANDQGIVLHTRTQPIRVDITFTLPRPKGHYRTGRNAHLLRDNAPQWPATKPDIDKLARSTLDALGSAGIYHDDAQVARLYVTKEYPLQAAWEKKGDALDRPGALIRITTLAGTA